MDTHPSEAQGLTPFQKFDTLMRRIIRVPKAEVERRAAEAKKRGMNAGNPGSIRLTKLDVAQRQLNTALDLWFHDGEPVSIYALAFASLKILRGVCNHRQITAPMLFELKRIRKGKESEYMQLIHKWPNFFKHADNDAGNALDFNPLAVEIVFYDAVEIFHKLTNQCSPLMTTFRLWFRVSYASYFEPKFFEMVQQTHDIARLRQLTRKEFFDFFNPVGVG